MKYKPTVPPGSTKANKTGGWRNYYPKVHHEKCIACGKCAKVCPDAVCFPVTEQAFQGKVFYDNDLDYCKGCGLCVKECPVKCIEMIEEEK